MALYKITFSQTICSLNHHISRPDRGSRRGCKIQKQKHSPVLAFGGFLPFVSSVISYDVSGFYFFDGLRGTASLETAFSDRADAAGGCHPVYLFPGTSLQDLAEDSMDRDGNGPAAFSSVLFILFSSFLWRVFEADSWSIEKAEVYPPLILFRFSV